MDEMERCGVVWRKNTGEIYCAADNHKFRDFVVSRIVVFSTVVIVRLQGVWYCLSCNQPYCQSASVFFKAKGKLCD